MNKDYILRGTAHHNSFRVFAVHSTTTAQTARDLHDLSPVATLLLGRMLSAAAMLSWDLKNPAGEFTLRVDGSGKLGGAVVICGADGAVRGYVKEPKLWFEDAADNLLPGKALGKGTLSVIRSEPGSTPYMGTCELVSGEIAEDLAYFYQQSEQIPTAVNLGILVDNNATVRASGGFIIQQLPNADPAIADIISANLQATPNVSDLMDMGLSLGEILTRFVFKGLKWKINEERDIAYRCNCSFERFSRALLMLGKQELTGMTEGIKPVCHYCNQEYVFTTEDIQALIVQAAKTNRFKGK